MSYHGYINYLQNRLSKINSPSVLEIGVDRGVTLIPIIVALASLHNKFIYVGVDIKIQESVQIMVQNLGSIILNSTFLLEGNSLSIIPGLIEQKMKFDVILIDGDHNYHTVSSELKNIQKLITPTGIIVVDDYTGKWATRDLFYSQREGYEDNKIATQPVITDKQGVQPAVDEWLIVNPEWKLYKPIEGGEPVILSREPI